MDRSRVAIVIPAFNEEKTISKVVRAANKFGKPIVINDGSKDNTGEIAKRSGAIVFMHKINLGYDAALNTGFKKAAKLKFDYIITLDADGQHDPRLLKRFINLLKSGAPMVLGVRNKKARLAEHFFGFYTNYRYGVKDPLCGLKGYRLQSYKLIKYFDNYNSIGTELMLRIILSGKNFNQVCFNVKKRDGKARFGSSIISNLKILRSLLIWIFKI